MRRGVFLLLVSAFCAAEQEYFTWVDAQGRVHNTAIERTSEVQSSDERPDVPTTENIQDGLRIDGEQYLTEEQFEEQAERDKQNNPPFFTFIDERGQVRSQEIIDTQIEVEEVVVPATYDHVLAPPFRVTERMSQSCCSRYQSYFKELVPAEKSVLFSGFLNTVPISTRFGPKKAWYFRLDEPSDFRVLELKLRSRQLPVDMVSLVLANASFQALYFVPVLSVIEKEATWSGQASADSLIKIEDDAVSSVIVYFPENAAESASLEVNWWHGKASD